MNTPKAKIVDSRVFLRVKLKSLAEEARIIRLEERRSTGLMRESLHLHRVQDVRSEARLTHIAYGLIRGRSIEQMEGRITKFSDFQWGKIKAMLKKYGPPGLADDPFRARPSKELAQAPAQPQAVAA